MSSNGIDLSNHNHPLDLSLITGLDFVIGKVTEGTGFVDTAFDSWAQQSAALGLAFGGYHFAHANEQNGRAQAEFFLDHFTPRPGWGVWLDYESGDHGQFYGPSGRSDAEFLGLFSMTIKYHYPRQRVGIYTNGDGLARINPYWSETNANALWYADDRSMIVQGALRPWQIHQYSTLGNIDRDYSVWSQKQMTDFFMS